jgi:outer membrane protein assembly factor BamB
MKNVLLYAFLFAFANCGSKGTTPEPELGTPKLVWRKSLTDVLSLTINPFIVGNKIIYSKTNGDAKPLVVFDKNTGDKLWEWSDFQGTPKRCHDELYTFNNVLATTSGTKVYGIDMTSGRTNWGTSSPETGSRDLGGIANHVFHLQKATVSGKTNTYLKDIDINSGTEKTLWQFVTNDDFQPGFDKPLSFIDSKGDTLLYFTLGGYTYLPKDSAKWQMVCYNLSKKQQQYQTTFYYGIYRGGAGSVPVITNGKIYLTMGSYVMCLNQSDGKFLWETPRQQNNSIGFLTIEDNKIFVCNDSQGVLCFDANTGRLLWENTESSSFSSRIAYLNGVIYYTNYGDGNLHAFEANTGKRLLKYSITVEGFQYVLTLDKQTKRLYLSTGKEAVCLEAIR